MRVTERTHEERAADRRAQYQVGAEQCTIGALLINSSRADEVDLRPEDFARREHSLIYSAILDMRRAGTAIDIVTVSEHLTRSNDIDSAGGIAYIASLASNTPSASNVLSYAATVRETAMCRRARGIMDEAIRDMAEDGRATIDRAIGELMHLTERGNRSYDCTIGDAVMLAINRLEFLQKNPGLVGITTGIEKLDHVTGGLQDSDLIVIAARPSMGKTSLLLNLAAAAGKAGHPSGVYSAEQPRIQIGQRMLALTARVSAARMRVARVDQQDWSAMIAVLPDLQGMPIYLSDRPGSDITHVMQQARRWRHDRGIKVLYVDYLQMIKGTDRRAKKMDQVAEVCDGLKDIARELDIPVVCLAQVKREVESRPNKRPGMADVSDSSEVEKVADNIWTMYRDEVYNRDTDIPGVVEIIVRKNRHGPIGAVRAKWVKQYMAFEELRADEMTADDLDRGEDQ